MGKRKIVRKQARPQPTSPLQERETENPPSPPPPPPPSAQPGTMIPATALEMFLRASNPNVDWSATIAAPSQVAGTVAAATATAPFTAVSPTTAPQTTTQITLAETSPQKSTSTTDQETSKPSPRQTLAEPLDISPISVYKLPGTRTEDGGEEKAEREETAEMEEETDNVGEKVEGDRGEEVVTGATQKEEAERDNKATEERQLDEMARKQGLMTDEEFQTLLEGAQRIGQEAVGMAEGLDLTSPAVEGEVPNEAASEPVELSTQPGEGVEKDQ